MKKFIATTGLFLMPLLILAIALELLLRHIPNDYELKKDYLTHRANETETLIFGSSHAFYGINPAYFALKTFNASHVSQSLNFDYAILEQYQSNFTNLKVIVLPISYFTLFETLEYTPGAWRVKNYVIYYGMKPVVSYTEHFEILSLRLHENMGRLISYYVKGIPAVTCSELGWGHIYHYQNAKNLQLTGIETAKSHTIVNRESVKNQAIFQNNLSILTSFFEWTKAHNIKLLLVTTPSYESYRNNLDQEQLNISNKTIQKLVQQYPHARYENWLADTRFGFTDFYDADHLSDLGAAKFSTLINQTIVDWENEQPYSER